MSGLYAIMVTNAVVGGKRARFEAEAADARLSTRFGKRGRSVPREIRVFAEPQPQATPAACCAA